MFCMKEYNTKTLSASGYGSPNGGAKQELCSYLNPCQPEKKLCPSAIGGTNPVKMSGGSVYIVLRCILSQMAFAGESE